MFIIQLLMIFAATICAHVTCKKTKNNFFTIISPPSPPTEANPILEHIPFVIATCRLLLSHLLLLRHVLALAVIVLPPRVSYPLI